ncbi:MAG: 4Fe-4S dicluster domain-containing protein [Clostridiaceae bacterium]|nr:4Fe-4S dicluster domain-containing protein [Clostridiaceae bacterium]
MRKCTDIPALLAKIAESRKVYLPVNGADGHAHYQEWANGVHLSDTLNTVRSAKDFFFPQTENLMDFKRRGKKIEIIDTRSETEDFVLFGVRACDARSFDILDRVFLTEPVDSYYASRREHGVIMTLACTRPAETCFCGTFGIDAADPGGDIACWKAGDTLYLDAKTEKGQALLDTLSSVTVPCGTDEVDTQKAETAACMKKLPLGTLSTEGFGGDQLDALFNDPKWASLSEACLGCGTCTFVCPTCQCYDIRDFDTGHGVKRFRCWDSCMYSDFTKMSAGQPRLTQLQRFRQRFLHKLVYYPANNDGIYSCVGCGRCLARCPISMNIVKVMKTLGRNDA